MDVLEILKSFVNEDGNISSDKLANVAKSINGAVGKEFVEKKRYNEKLTEIDNLKGEKQNAEDKATSAEKWKTKYDALKEDFDTFKNDVSAKEAKANRQNAYKELLKKAGVSEKRINSVLRVADIDNLEMENGKFKDAEKLVDGIKEEWADFIESTHTEGADVPTPPTNNGGKTMTKDEIMNIKDAGERQQAIADNHQLFGF